MKNDEPSRIPSDANTGSRRRMNWLWLAIGIVLVGGGLVFGAIWHDPERDPAAASASDTGPITIITDDPTCRTFSTSNREVFDTLNSSEPHARELKLLEIPLDAVAQLAKQTPHRVMRELYEQYVAYTYALIDHSDRPSQVGRTEGATYALTGLAHTLVGICEAITSGAAEDSHPPGNPLPTADTPSPSDTPSRPVVFLDTPDRTCENWRTTALAIGPDDTFSAVPTPLAPTGVRTEFPTEQALSDRIGYLSLSENRGDNPTFRDFSDLGRAYLNGYRESSKSEVLATYHAVVKLLRGACAYSEIS